MKILPFVSAALISWKEWLRDMIILVNLNMGDARTVTGTRRIFQKMLEYANCVFKNRTKNKKEGRNDNKN